MDNEKNLQERIDKSINEIMDKFEPFEELDFTKELVRPIVEKIMNTRNGSYTLVSELLYNNLYSKYIPEDRGSELYNKFSIYGNSWLRSLKSYYKTSSEYKSDFEYSGWLTYIKNEYVSIYGKKHTLSEAAHIAADLWSDLLFKFHIKDNGGLDEKPSMIASMISTTLAKQVNEEITEETKKKVNENIYNLYIESENIMLATDYGPNGDLYDVLIKSGIKDSYIDDICPWKTNIYIDQTDYSVVYSTYHSEKRM